MNNLLVRSLVAWFNDGKRLTALLIAVTQLAFPWLRAKGVPIPEAAENAVGAWIGTLVLLLLSKLDVRLPVSVPKV